MENIWNLFLDVIKDMLIFFGIWLWYYSFLRGLFTVLQHKILFPKEKENVKIDQDFKDEFIFISLLLTIGTYSFKALFFK